MSSKLLDFKLSPLGKDINPAQSVKDLWVISNPTLSFDICIVLHVEMISNEPY